MITALVLSALAASAGTAQAPIGPGSLTLLGFTLAKNEIGDVERRLGSARASAAQQHDMTQRCYESNGTDHTVVVFRDWVGTLSGFSIYTAASNPRCTKTSLVRSDISTASGLKLGLSPEQVIQILGKPTRRAGSQFVYEDRSEKPLTAEEVADYRRTHPGETGSDLHIWNFTEIKLRFRNSRLSSIDVTHTETT
jgi:hypothetical protein